MRTNAGGNATARFEYAVDVVDFHSLKGALNGPAIEKVLGERARDGWRVVSVIPGDVNSGFGAGKSAGVAITFERPAR